MREHGAFATNFPADGLGFNANVKSTNPKINKWIIKHAEALSHTQKGIPAGHYIGNSALSSDKQTLYLFVEGTPNGPIAIKGLKNNISRIRVVGFFWCESHRKRPLDLSAAVC